MTLIIIIYFLRGGCMPVENFSLLLLYFFHYHLSPLQSLPPPPTTFPHNPHTVVHVHESFFLFNRSLHPLNHPPPELSACSLPKSTSLFCVLVSFVHQSKIRWYLSFSGCLISLSIMFSRYILDTLEQGNNPMFSELYELLFI